MTLVNQLLIVLLFCSAIIPNQHVSSLAIENEPIIPPAFECPTQNGVYFYAAGPCLPYYYRCVNGNPNKEYCSLGGTIFSPNIMGCVNPALISGCQSAI